MDTMTHERIAEIGRAAVREMARKGGLARGARKRAAAMANLSLVDPAKRLAASNAAQKARRERERATQDGNHITGVVIAQAQAAVRKARGL